MKLVSWELERERDWEEKYREDRWQGKTVGRLKLERNIVQLRWGPPLSATAATRIQKTMGAERVSLEPEMRCTNTVKRSAKCSVRRPSVRRNSTPITPQLLSKGIPCEIASMGISRGELTLKKSNGESVHGHATYYFRASSPMYLLWMCWKIDWGTSH